MFERFTERARRTIFFARYIASLGGSPEIEAEYLLMGLLREDQSLARRFFGSPWAVDSVWRQVERSKGVREKPLNARTDLPLSNAGKRVLAFTADEAHRLSNQYIGTGHLLLGLLREENCFVAEILRQHGLCLASTREDLARVPHDDSAFEEFVREGSSLPKVVEFRTRIASIMRDAREAAANHDFEKAHSNIGKERTEREKLYTLCQQYGLMDWLYIEEPKQSVRLSQHREFNQ